MKPSAALCRTQEAFHRNRAAGTSLDNVRTIAEKAAAAWGLEALSAERRELRLHRPAPMPDPHPGDQRCAHENDEGSFSENPDRGLVSA